jgi:hypothetical protein
MKGGLRANLQQWQARSTAIALPDPERKRPLSADVRRSIARQVHRADRLQIQ